ncbi:bifunctional glucose-1-phosphatase/inositol phosphatase [Pragia fontium]|uniref:Glucose-1-phosphatase n=2 Tax=Pragia fontium TaxID=82985 RepID=A0AAJ5BH43_9GAMM|nr:bifunctional glucose-1-phosphatase/inositol phosphatase [Pragia fontium]GKX61483.1 bifunctional glucose-1-phosphatase/inositol phosphatase [Pragia fontium]SFC78478.1 glucose-1-phosphatase [Pragia fontium DSM 5563 = ATCC 49100]SUB82713.1 Glucose-1-phosphatase precursor [Pragia fontium]VEJ55615.1 Glucose-1-phosphatase precursor [Pragia fontium]
MKKFTSRALLCCLPMVIPFAPTASAADSGYELKQVFMFSRHGLRAPLANSGSVLATSTPKTWPKWETKGGYLTPKGGVLENYFGHYVNAWMVKENLFSKDTCPVQGETFIYANSLQRTVATAQYFTLGAFPGCDVKILHQAEIGIMDSTFNPIIRDGSEQFKQSALKAMNNEAGPKGLDGLNKQLKPAYDLLDKLTDYKNSSVCQNDKRCDLNSEPAEFTLVKNKEPGVTGPLRIGTSISDAFILQYYQGFPLQDVAWGGIKSDAEWNKLAEIKDRYGEVLFGSPIVAKNVAAPLIKYMNVIFNDNEVTKPVKFNMMVGHDSNVVSLLSVLKIKDYQLPGQFEKTPIGGKIVFERWKDKSNNKDLIKIEYLYQTKEQIRHAEPLSLEHPPQRVVLEMENCPIDANGFCSFDDFTKILKSAI